MTITFAEGLTIAKDIMFLISLVSTSRVAWEGLRGWQKQKEFEALSEATARLKELHEAIRQCRSPEIYISNFDAAKFGSLGSSDHVNLIYYEVIQRFEKVKETMMHFRREFMKSEVFTSRRKGYEEGKEAIQHLERLCCELQTSIQYYFSQRSIGISVFDYKLKEHHATVFQQKKYDRIHVNSDFEKLNYEGFQKRLDVCVDKIDNLLRPI